MKMKNKKNTPVLRHAELVSASLNCERRVSQKATLRQAQGDKFRCIIWVIIAAFLFSFQTDNLVEWKESRKLTWDDFQGKPDPSSPYKAKTESNFTFEIGTRGQQMGIRMENYFNKSASWVKQKTSLLLEHEQTHFDISELWLRKFKKQLLGKTFNIKTAQAELNAMQKEINKGGKEMNMLYDKETEHSVNQVAQKKWNKKIAEELKLMNAYINPVVTCKLVK